MSSKTRLQVVYEDGTETEVLVGQREYAKWEGQSFGCAASKINEESPLMFQRWVAWAVLARAGERRSWPVWDDQVDEVNEIEEADEAPTPTVAGQSDAT